ncbi:hypothetical protein [Salegentibacter flavus]|uniref:PD-(D/E)XK nuclease superfamily protein n=1 Tax=Salegentibacter flavus TaxID=287099 RepID=A0A1I4YJ95_9FLAO|nr:hypothetical protein [Salegentibacter flavus]SFN37893.1 hypothetical protein SAMN05660413_00764 [Salegentibacter flavus]
MNKKQVLSTIQKSLKILYAKDSLLMNSAYDINERKITHRLAMYLEPFFKKEGYVVDVEYNRIRGDYDSDAVGNLMGKKLEWHDQGSSFVYPDIIVHKRDTNDNLLLIEVKMAWKNSKRQNDFLRINEYLKEFDYKYGIYLELSEIYDECQMVSGPFT